MLSVVWPRLRASSLIESYAPAGEGNEASYIVLYNSPAAKALSRNIIVWLEGIAGQVSASVAIQRQLLLNSLVIAVKPFYQRNRAWRKTGVNPGLSGHITCLGGELMDVDVFVSRLNRFEVFSPCSGFWTRASEFSAHDEVLIGG